MHIALTGATGYTGSQLTPRLLAAGHRVVDLTNSERALLRRAGRRTVFTPA